MNASCSMSRFLITFSITILLHLHDVVQKCMQVESGAINEDALWLGPLQRGNWLGLGGLGSALTASLV